jgi:5-methylcytosine-specific restriction endonuclease McrA
VLKSHLLDEAVFCDPIRYPNDTLKDEIRERFKGLCSEGNHIISPGEEEFHHVKQYQEGGRTNAQNLILLCRKHHQVETKNNISKTAGAS